MAMTRDEFQHALRRNGLTVQEFADEFGLNFRTVYRWGADASVPRWAVKILAIMDQHGRGIVLRGDFVMARREASGRGT